MIEFKLALSNIRYDKLIIIYSIHVYCIPTVQLTKIGILVANRPKFFDERNHFNILKLKLIENDILLE